MTRTIGNLENERRISKRKRSTGKQLWRRLRRAILGHRSRTQSEFAAIKDTLTKVKLRADLRLCDYRQGIRRSDQTTHNVCLFQCSSYLQFCCSRSAIFKGNFQPLYYKASLTSLRRVFSALYKRTLQLKTATALAEAKTRQSSPARSTRVPFRNFTAFKKPHKFRPFSSRRVPFSRSSNSGSSSHRPQSPGV